MSSPFIMVHQLHPQVSQTDASALKGKKPCELLGVILIYIGQRKKKEPEGS
jgi:hypothetical protein